jgi:NAD(P)-dependent dehydrogenase (short-subunit alcohol dehydrogenase family)
VEAVSILIMTSLKGKVSIITGGTSGMGEGVALKFSEEGSKIVIGGRDVQKGESLVSKLKEKGREAVFVPGDVSEASVNKKLVEAAVSSFGRIDILVMSAGRLGLGKITEVSEDEWEKTIDVNLNAVFYLLKYAIPEMNKDGGGNIVVIGSVAAFHAFPGHPAYCASKGALAALVRQVAADYGPLIRINLLCPAQVDTPLLRDSVKAFENPLTIISETEAKLPLKRLGTPKDIADAVHFLASDSSSWITGSCLTVDGGFLCT